MYRFMEIIYNIFLNILTVYIRLVTSANSASVMKNIPGRTSPNFTAVIILTYMRSGSSLVGDILQQSPEAFYIYEPLHTLQHMSREDQRANIAFVNGTFR